MNTGKKQNKSKPHTIACDLVIILITLRCLPVLA